MKFVTIFFVFIFMLLFQGVIFAGDEESEVLNEKKVWNLLQDLKDYKAGRLKFWSAGSAGIDTPANDADYVTLRAHPEDPNTHATLGFSFPVPTSSKISMMIIEMDFKWPSSKGEFKVTVNQNESMNTGTGVSFSYKTSPGKIKVGKLNGSCLKKIISNSLSPMGSGSHSLKIVYNKNGALLVTFDKKVMNLSFSITPNAITLAGVDFESIKITRLQAQIIMTDSKE